MRLFLVVNHVENRDTLLCLEDVNGGQQRQGMPCCSETTHYDLLVLFILQQQQSVVPAGIICAYVRTSCVHVVPSSGCLSITNNSSGWTIVTHEVDEPSTMLRRGHTMVGGKRTAVANMPCRSGTNHDIGSIIDDSIHWTDHHLIIIYYYR